MLFRSRYSPITKTHELANKWMNAQKISKQEGIYPISKYQQLRYALEDANMDKARDEYSKLLKTSTAGKIAVGFRQSVHAPFTGSLKTDKEFAASLKEHDRMIYERALETKRNIVMRFNAIGDANTNSLQNRDINR